MKYDGLAVCESGILHLRFMANDCEGRDGASERKAWASLDLEPRLRGLAGPSSDY